MTFKSGDRVIRTEGHRAGSYATVIRDREEDYGVYLCFDDPVNEKEECWSAARWSIKLVDNSDYDMD